MLQTQKKVKRGIRTYTKEAAENRRTACIRYRKDISTGFNLLIKWVPGTETLIRGEILIETVNYIKKLQNELKEVKEQSLKKSKKRENYIKELQKKIKELETSQTAINTAPREIHSSPSEPEVVLASTPTGASTSSTMDAAVQTTSEAESVTLDEELPEEELPEEELLASGIPEFNSMEDFRKWLEL
jgi:hypothetical protein